MQAMPRSRWNSLTGQRVAAIDKRGVIAPAEPCLTGFPVTRNSR